MTNQANPAADRFKGFCFDYDRYRPVPPKDLMDLGAGWAGAGPLELIVDLGCGTGLSTRPWAGKARRVIGIDPSEDMLRTAREATKEANVTYRPGTGHRTELEDGCADVVTCSSAAHWMEPAPTVREIARILRHNGVLMIYGHYYPVFLTSPGLTAFYEQWRRNLDDMEYRAEQQAARKWPLTELYKAVKEHGAFGYERRHYMHCRLSWSREAVGGFFRAHAGVPFLAQRGYSNHDLMLDALDERLSALPNEASLDVHLTYSVFIAIRDGQITTGQ
jgi:SAM-dependent methyltransferase